MRICSQGVCLYIVRGRRLKYPNAGILSNSRLLRSSRFASLPRIAFMDRAKRRGRGSLEYEYQRTYKACIPCARRKVKCEAGDNVRCRRCIKKNINCTFTSKKPWSRDQKNSPETPIRENTERDGSNKCVCLDSER